MDAEAILERFKEQLRLASDEYDNNVHDGGMSAIRATQQLIYEVFGSDLEGVTRPFDQICTAFLDRQRGLVPRYFQPTRKVQGRPLGCNDQMIRAVAADCIAIFVELDSDSSRSSRESRNHAASVIAKILKRCRYPIKGSSAKSPAAIVLTWRSNILNDRYGEFVKQLYETNLEVLRGELDSLPTPAEMRAKLFDNFESIVRHYGLPEEYISPPLE